MSLLWILLALLAIAVLFSATSQSQIQLILNNQSSGALYFDYRANTATIEPHIQILNAKQSQALSIKSQNWQTLTAAISVYPTQSKLHKVAVIVLKRGRVLVRQAQNCRVQQVQPHTTLITFGD